MILAAIVACITGESVIKAVSDSAVRNTISPLLTHPVCWCSMLSLMVGSNSQLPWAALATGGLLLEITGK